MSAGAAAGRAGAGLPGPRRLSVTGAQGMRLEVAVDDNTDPWRRQRQAVLLQHGYGRSGRFWSRWVPALSRDFIVIRPDLRGLGGSGAAGAADLTLENYVADRMAILDQLGRASRRTRSRALS